MAIDPEDVKCGACGTLGECMPLGSLGRTAWFRCRACGMDVSVTPKEPTRKAPAAKKSAPRKNPRGSVRTVSHSLSMEPGWPV